MKKASTNEKQLKQRIRFSSLPSIAFVLSLWVDLEGSLWGQGKTLPLQNIQSMDEVKPAFEQRNVVIVFGCDDNYALYLGVCLLSLISNSSEDRNYDVWILDGGISEDKRKNLFSLIQNRKNFSLRFFDISRLVSDNKEKLRIYSRHVSLTIATYFRLFIPQIFSAYDRVIYLDCDMIINADVGKLFSVDLEGKTIGAVGCAAQCSQSFQQNAKSIRGDKWQSYFYPGVMVFDIKKAIDKNITGRSLKFLATIQNSKERFFEDQDALNSACIDVKLLDKRWLLLVGRAKCSSKRLEDNYIVHYCRKPWREHTHLDDVWWSYAAKTSFYLDILAHNWKLIIKKMAIIQISYFLVSFEYRWFHKFLPEYERELSITSKKKILLDLRKMAAYGHLKNFCFNYLRKYMKWFKFGK
ncbi:MAG: glycosyltransferase family 8 protein [Holosporaceae bacterium]|jgi:lipopolysaccharide biosynthesis glycosyltransferase|nr:glycosyltransferase family 8 protein [Holosporaceae bacterium]